MHGGGRRDLARAPRRGDVRARRLLRRVRRLQQARAADPPPEHARRGPDRARVQGGRLRRAACRAAAGPDAARGRLLLEHRGRHQQQGALAGGGAGGDRRLAGASRRTPTPRWTRTRRWPPTRPTTSSGARAGRATAATSASRRTRTTRSTPSPSGSASRTAPNPVVSRAVGEALPAGVAHAVLGPPGTSPRRAVWARPGRVEPFLARPGSFQVVAYFAVVGVAGVAAAACFGWSASSSS